MGGEPKQFRLLDDRPMMCWAANAMLKRLTGPLVVVLPGGAIEEGRKLLRDHIGKAFERIQVATGGPCRQDSVLAGLRVLNDVEIVLIHDAVRPFATANLVERVAHRVTEGEVVVPAVQIHDTLKEVEDERVVRTHERSRYVAAQTPQGFPLAVIRRAHEEAPHGEATDDAQLCEEAGLPVIWIPGESLNRKLTDREDWEWAERTVASGRVRWSQ